MLWNVTLSFCSNIWSAALWVPLTTGGEECALQSLWAGQGTTRKIPFWWCNCKSITPQWFWYNLLKSLGSSNKAANKCQAAYSWLSFSSARCRVGKAQLPGPGCQVARTEAADLGPCSCSSLCIPAPKGKPAINRTYFSYCATFLFYQSTDRCAWLMMCVKRNLAATKITFLFRQPSPLTLWHLVKRGQIAQTAEP